MKKVCSEHPTISHFVLEDEADDAFLDYDYGITPSHFRRKLFQEAEMKRRNGRRELRMLSKIKLLFSHLISGHVSSQTTVR